jgi:AcrR family transcriptional regulator
MAPQELFEDVEDETKAAIMRATFRALCEHGYANLTIQRIGDEFEKSKSLLYHHYDGKDELLLDFLDSLLAGFTADAPEGESTPGVDCLSSILDRHFSTEVDGDRLAFMKAMVELRAQAAHDEAYRKHFTRSDQFFRDRIEEVIEAGIEAGEFEDVDAEAFAAMLVTLINGSFVERVTTDGDGIPHTREAVEAYLDSTLATDSDR